MTGLRRLQLQARALQEGDYLYWGEAYLAVQDMRYALRRERVVLTLGNGGPVVTVFLSPDALLDVRRPRTPGAT